MRKLTAEKLALFDGLAESPTGEKMQALRRSDPYLWALTALHLIELELPPPLASEVRTARTRLAARIERTEATIRAAILTAIGAGYWRADEISQYTGIHPSTTYRHLQQLIESKQLIRCKPDHNEPGRGGDRKSHLYKLRER